MGFDLYSFQPWLVACTDVDRASQLYRVLNDIGRNYGIGCRMFGNFLETCGNIHKKDRSTEPPPRERGCMEVTSSQT